MNFIIKPIKEYFKKIEDKRIAEHEANERRKRVLQQIILEEQERKLELEREYESKYYEVATINVDDSTIVFLGHPDNNIDHICSFNVTGNISDWKIQQIKSNIEMELNKIKYEKLNQEYFMILNDALLQAKANIPYFKEN